MTDDRDITIARLEKRLARERKARKAAEEILSDKSTELYYEHERMENAKSLLEMALWASGESIWSWHKEKDSFFVKEFRANRTQVEEYEISFETYKTLIHPADLDAFLISWQHNKMGLEPEVDQLYRIQKQDKYIWVRSRGRVVSFDDNAAQSIVGTIKDVTYQRDTEVSFKLMSYAFSQSREPMLILSKSMQVIEGNSAFLQLTDTSAIDIVDKSITDFIELARKHVDQLKQMASLRAESKLLIGEHRKVPVEVSMSEFTDSDGNKEYIITTLRDLTEQKQAERKLYRLAHFDPLTSLLNRPALQERLEELLSDQKYPYLAVFFIDLDGFKNVNDTMGHEHGDRLLQDISGALSTTLSPFTILSRWGGDEFIVIYPHNEEGAWQAKAEKITECISTHPLDINGQQISISASVGIALYPEHGADVDTLLRNADAAMYKAKSQGKNQSQCYYQGLTDEAVKRVTLLSELRKALDNNGLDFVVQGKYSDEQVLIGGEVLCRWKSALYGQIPPSEFVPIIENNGLEDKLGLLAMQAAAEFIVTLDKYQIDVPISVNISANQILSDQFLADALHICEKFQVAPELIELEITESVFMSDQVSASSALDRLQKSGFRISLDDFGTGYSSLSYLRQFNFDVVKIDRSFILDLEHSERAYSLFLSILEMCKALETETIVEGIETEVQYELLREAGVSSFQGFLFGKPMPIGEFIRVNVVI